MHAKAARRFCLVQIIFRSTAAIWKLLGFDSADSRVYRGASNLIYIPNTILACRGAVAIAVSVRSLTKQPFTAAILNVGASKVRNA